jgi:hypothetical protein
LPSEGQGDGGFLKIVCFFWKIILQAMPGNVVISDVDALVCLVLSRSEKHVPNEELVGTTECIMP